MFLDYKTKLPPLIRPPNFLHNKFLKFFFWEMKKGERECLSGRIINVFNWPWWLYLVRIVYKAGQERRLIH
ncbi:hypothetical protein SAMN04488128_107223 [Chitinophaga eiseniae]|uniref:Uncharacterized protein n=1 Tax=Chitinophaga eiseniae TaxID=634771 RepID=A0A1T4U0F0_9BACT|nr:hypothetical protein SAMN04488128_107223 [Chitinophaga eiseniae]